MTRALLALALAATGCLDADRGGGGADEIDAAPDDASAGGAADGGADAASGAVDAGPCAAFVDDDFDDAGYASDWATVITGDGDLGMLDQSGGAVTIELALTVSDDPGRIGLVSDAQAVPTGTLLEAAVKLSSAGAGRAGIGWVTDAGAYVALYFEGNEIVAARGTTGDPAVPLCDPCPAQDSAATMLLRIHGDSDKITFQRLASSDLDWVSVGSTVNDLAPASVSVALFAEGTAGGTSAENVVDAVRWAPVCDETAPP